MMTRKIWLDFWRKLRKNGRARDFFGPDDPLVEKAAFHAHIRTKTVDGKVSVNFSAMDCDCATYGSGSVEWAIPTSIEKHFNDLYAGAEGPMSIWVDYPSRIHTQRSRDLVLEAYEDGHPHSVSEVRYDEDGDYQLDNPNYPRAYQ